MKNFLLLLVTLTLLTSCSGKLSPGKEEGLSKTPATGDGGNNGDGSVDNGGGTVGAPIITMINLKGGEVIPGGKTYKIFFSVKDDYIGFNEVKVEYQRDGDTGWKTIAEKLTTLSDVETSLDWPVCPQTGDERCLGQTDGDGYRIRITARGGDDFVTTATSTSTFAIDSQAPSLSTSGLSLKPGFPQNGFIQFELSGATDSMSPISDVCVKSMDATDPEPSDSCWVSVEAYGSTKALSPSTITISQYLGFFNGTYDFYVWVRDAAGNATSMTLNDSGSPGVSKDTLRVPYAYTNYPLWKDAAGDFVFNTDTSGVAGLTTYSGVPMDNATTMADPGSVVMNSKGQMIVIDKNAGLVLVDLISRSRTSLVSLGGSLIEGPTGPSGSARLKNPLHIGVDEDDWIWIQDEDHLAYIDNSGALNIAAGGGSNTNDVLLNPLQLRINYHVNMKWYGTFAVLPNKQIIFNSEDPHAALNPDSGSRFRLRVYYGNENGRIDSIAFSGVYGTNDVKDLVPYGGMAFTYDTTRKYIKDIVGRFCAESAGTCAETLMLAFSAKGTNPVLLNNHSNWSNVVLRASLNNIYAFNSQRGFLSRLDFTSKTWSKNLGGSARGTAYCNDGVPSTSCNVRLTDVFITKQDRIFFMDHSRLRSVELDGRVRTLYNPEFDILNAANCATLKAAGHNANDYYSIDPDGVGGNAPFTAYCDMTTDGGGWTLIARSVAGATGNFGWKVSRGHVMDDTQPFSMGPSAQDLLFTSILFGNLSTGKSWGGYVYRWGNLPTTFMADYASTHFTNIATRPTPVVGGNTDFTMARYLGHTDNNLRYFFRDNTANDDYGLRAQGWKTSGTGDFSGYLHGLQGMIFAR